MRHVLIEERDGTARLREWPLRGLEDPQSITNAREVISMTPTGKGVEQYKRYEQLYRENPWVFAAIEVKSHNLARLPARVYTQDDDGSLRKVRGWASSGDGRLSAEQNLQRILEVPEPRVSRYEWLNKLWHDRYLYGNAIATIEMRQDGTLQELRHVPWRHVEVQEGTQVPIAQYKLSGSRGSRSYIPDRVIHFGKSGDFDSPIGVSPLSSLHYTMKLHDALWRHLTSYFEKGMRPTGIYRTKTHDENVVDHIRESIRKLYQGVDNAGSVMVTSAEFQAIEATQDQGDIVQLAKLSREEIAAAFQVPPPILGILDRAILNNTKELRGYFMRDVLGPDIEEFDGALQAQLLVPTRSLQFLVVHLDLSQAIKPDLKDRADVYEKLRHVYTVNELREMDGLPRIDDELADVPWMPSGQVPVDAERFDAAAQPAAPAGGATNPLARARHGQHDQSSHGNWAGGGGGSLHESLQRGPNGEPSLMAESFATSLQTPDGGFTVDPHTGNEQQFGVPAYAVAIYPQHEKSVSAAEVTGETVQGYLESTSSAWGSDKQAKVGGWHDPASGVAYLDVSRVVSDKETAMQLGREHNQLAIFDFGTGASIEVRHYAGKHDQSAHGNWAAGTSSRRSDLPPKGQAAVDSAMDKYGVSHEDMVSEITGKVDAMDPDLREQAFDWYPQAHEIAAEYAVQYGVDTETAAAVISATSPRCPWAHNKTLASNILDKDRGLTHLSPDDAAKQLNHGMTKMISDGIRMRRGGPSEADASLGGMKRRSFYNNIAYPGQTDDVTVDTWMMHAAVNVSTKGMTKADAGKFLNASKTSTQGAGAGYVAIADATRAAAAQAGVSPDAMQAAYWVALNGTTA